MKQFKDVAHHYLRSGLGIKFLRTDDNTWQDAVINVSDYPFLRTKQLKPVMYDMSDIDKEITHNGETFVPIDKLNETFHYQYEMDGKWIMLNVKNVLALNVFAEPMEMIELLIEWHFNVFQIEGTINKMELK